MKETDQEQEAYDDLMERVSRQSASIRALIAERNSLRERIKQLDVWQTECLRLQRQLRSIGAAADLMDIVRRFREAVRDEHTGDFIGGANRRRILADVDDAAVIAISAIESRGGRDTEKEKQ